MTVYINQKTIKNLNQTVKAVPIVLDAVPNTTGELILAIARACVKAFRERLQIREATVLISDEAFEEMREMGRFIFGNLYNDSDIDENQALSTVCTAYCDGLVRVFQNHQELSFWDDPITVSKGDTFTFTKLVMLSGHLW